MTTHARLLTAAADHHWVLSATELDALGFTQSAIRHRERTGILHRVHTGVYAVGRPELAPEGRWRAGTLLHPDGGLSGLCAAASWGVVRSTPTVVDVAVPTQSGRRKRDGLDVHRCDRLTDADLTWRRGIRVTTLQRTLRDLAGILDERGLTRAIRQAERLHRIDLLALHVAMGPARPGANRENLLRKALDAYIPADVGEGLEEVGLELFVGGGLPIPETQHPIGPFFADFAWPDVRLVVETDDRASHFTWTSAQEDRARDRYMASAGWEVMRFTWAEITRQPDMVVEQIAAALVRRRASVVPATPARL